jgi:hypothetical protein
LTRNLKLADDIMLTVRNLQRFIWNQKFLHVKMSCAWIHDDA